MTTPQTDAALAVLALAFVGTQVQIYRLRKKVKRMAETVQDVLTAEAAFETAVETAITTEATTVQTAIDALQAQIGPAVDLTPITDALTASQTRLVAAITAIPTTASAPATPAPPATP